MINAVPLLLAGVLAVNTVSGQLPKYFVCLQKGENTLKKPGKKAVPLKHKDLIYQDDLIEIKKEDAEIQLVDRDSNYIVLTAKRLYKAADLDQQIRIKTTGLTRRYFHLLWEDLLQPESNLTIFSKRNFAGAWGGGRRGFQEYNLVWLPNDGECISTDTVTFTWTPESSARSYHFILSNDHHEEVMNLILRDTSLTSIVSGLKGPAKARFYWSVQALPRSRDASRFYFYLLTREEEKRAIESILQGIDKEDLALYHLRAADALLNKGFIKEANLYLGKVLKE